MKPRRYIVDTTLRDGEQCPGLLLSCEQKVKLAALLESCGVYQIEAGTPALGGCEIDSIRAIMAQRKNVKISTWNRMRESDLAASLACAPDIIHISAPVSMIHIQKKLKKDASFVERQLLKCVELARMHGYEVTVGFEDASRASIAFMAHLANAVKPLGVRRIRFADTAGILAPIAMGERIARLMELCDVEIQAHAHNDLGLAVGNTLASALHGAMYLDTTLCGIGERAGGCDLHQLSIAAESLFTLGMDTCAVESATQALEQMLSIPFDQKRQTEWLI